MDDQTANPYVGPRPYERDESGRFFGRDAEIRRLVSQIVSHRVVLLYAASGAGKSSLLSAGLIAVLEQEEEFEVLPVARVIGLGEHDPESGAGNAYAAGVIACWGDVGTTLRECLRRRERARTRDGFPAPRALIIDQFEELFTLYPERWEDREGFFRQLADAIDDGQPLRVVLSIREDFIAELDPYASLLPQGLGTRFRLERLRAAAAREAVTQPLAGTSRSFAPEAVDELVDDLLTVDVKRADGSTIPVTGEFVEPVQLQVACSSLWTRLPADVDVIRPEHLVAFGDMDAVLGHFYDEAIEAAATRARRPQLRLRRRFEQAFITPLGTRGTVLWTPAQTGGLPAAAVAELDRRHVIRAEARAGARWYELTHDRMIGPIRASNRARLERRRRRQLSAAGATILVLLAIGLSAVEVSDRVPAPAADPTLALAVQQAASLRSTIATLQGHLGAVRSVEFSPDGRLLLTVSDDRTARIWASATGRSLGVLAGPGPSRIRSGTFAPNGRFVLTGDGGGRVKLWEVPDGSVRVLGHDGGPVDAVAVSPDGTRLASATRDGFLTIRDTVGRARRMTSGRPLVSVAFSPNGSVVAAGAGDGTVLVAPAAGGPVSRIPGRGGPATSLSFDRTGDRLLIAGGAAATVWDLRSRRPIIMVRPSSGVARRAVFNPRATEFATTGSDGAVRVWSATSGRPVTRFAAGTRPEGCGDLVFGGRSGSTLIAACDDGTVPGWDVRSGRSIGVLRGHSGPVNALALARDGTLLATAGQDKTARLWAAGRRLPDLALGTVSQIYEASRRLTLRAQIVNAGASRSEPTTLSAGGSDGSATGANVGSIGPGGSVSRRMVITLLTRRPDARIVLEVDPDNLVPESSESNNTLVLRVAAVRDARAPDSREPAANATPTAIPTLGATHGASPARPPPAP
jgi:WD40 repeat protein